jgi:hypothetical protein
LLHADKRLDRHDEANNGPESCQSPSYSPETARISLIHYFAISLLTELFVAKRKQFNALQGEEHVNCILQARSDLSENTPHLHYKINRLIML